MLYRSAYNASKHALHGLFDTLRMELEGTGVSVTLACPGFTATDLRKNALVGDGSVTRQPVQVLGSQVASPVEVAEAIFQGAARRRRLLVLSNVNWRARLLARFFPRLFESCWCRACRDSSRNPDGAQWAWSWASKPWLMSQ